MLKGELYYHVAHAHLLSRCPCASAITLPMRICYHVAHAHLQEQDHRNRDFDLKAAGCLGIATTITGMGAILLNGFLNNSSREMTTLSLVFIALSALVYICTLGCGLLVMRLREWRFDPDLSKFAAYLPDYDDEAFVEWAGDQFKNSAESNSKVLARKARFLMASFLLTLSLPILLFALVLTLVGSKSRLFFSVSGALGGLRRGRGGLGFGGGGLGGDDLGSAIQCLPFGMD